MRLLLRFAALAGLVLSGWAAPPRAQAANLDGTADRVFGQVNFTHNGGNNPILGASSLDAPTHMAFDAQGNLYVADGDNSRVLEYDAPLTTDRVADHVIGQPGFANNADNTNGLSASSLSRPEGLALDAQGNLFVADGGNNRVLEYDAPLTTDFIADRVFGQPDFLHNNENTNGLGPAGLNGPNGVALDAQGSLYVADASNNRVLRYDRPLGGFTSAGTVFGQPNFVSNGPNTGAAGLFVPTDVAVDGLGNLYVADAFNNRLLEYDNPPGSDRSADRVFGQGGSFTTTLINKGGVSANSLNEPFGLALDTQGNLYVADTQNHRVLEYSLPLLGSTADLVIGQGGSFTTAVSNKGGLGASVLNGPRGVALDAQGNLYVADTANSRALEYDVPVPHGSPTLAALSPNSVAAGSAAFTLTANGAFFVAGSVVRWNGSDRPTTFLSGRQLSAALSAADLAGGGPYTVTGFTPAPGGGPSNPLSLSLYARGGHDATADVEQGQAGFAAHIINDPLMPGAGRFNFPLGVAVDQHSGRLFVADNDNRRVLSWSNAPAFANGQPADLALGKPNLLADFSHFDGISARRLGTPDAIAVDNLGNVYVADGANNRVLEFNAPLSTGMAASHVFGQLGSFTSTVENKGGVTANSLREPVGLAVDGQGNLYVADLGNNRVLEYNTPLSSGTTADRVFGQLGSFTTTLPNKGGVTANSLFAPGGLALDEQGRLYLADSNNNRLLEYDAPLAPDRTADHVFGQLDFTHNGSAAVSATSLSRPTAVALDGWGNLYAADANNNRVLEYDAPLTTDATADRVFGQPDFVSNIPNNGGVSRTSLSNPVGVAVDVQGNLYVVDELNMRLLEYDWALARINLPLIRR